MSVRETYLQAVRAYVIGQTGLPATSVFIAPISTPRPTMPYASVGSLSRSPVGTPQIVYSLDPVTSAPKKAMRQHYRATVAVAFYGDDASDYATALHVGMGDTRAAALTTGVNIASVISSTDGQTWRGTAWEVPTTVDLEVAFSATQIPGQIETVDLVNYGITLDRYDGDPAPLTGTGSVEV